MTSHKVLHAKRLGFANFPNFNIHTQLAPILIEKRPIKVKYFTRKLIKKSFFSNNILSFKYFLFEREWKNTKECHNSFLIIIIRKNTYFCLEWKWKWPGVSIHVKILWLTIFFFCLFARLEIFFCTYQGFWIRLWISVDFMSLFAFGFGFISKLSAVGWFNVKVFNIFSTNQYFFCSFWVLLFYSKKNLNSNLVTQFFFVKFFYFLLISIFCLNFSWFKAKK